MGTHDRKHMPFSAAFVCKHNSAGCSCQCDHSAGCCAQANTVVGQAPKLPGNTYHGVTSPSSCCEMCSRHVDCFAFELEDSKCTLMGGSPILVNVSIAALAEGRAIVSGLTRG